MTITARQTSTRIHAIRTLVDKLATLPLAVGEIHRAIDLGTINERDDRQQAEDAGIRSKGGHSDPTGERAIQHVTAHERHLDDVEPERPDRAPQPRQIGRRRPAHYPLLPRIDGMQARHERTRGPRLHLDEHQDSAVAAHQIKLVAPVARAAPVARNDREAAFAPQPFGREPLAPGAGVLGPRATK